MVKDSGKVNIHGKEYETVASRVQRFRQEHADKYGILTEVIDRDEQMVVVKASIVYHHTVSTQQGVLSVSDVIATGYAEEVRGSSSINRTSALENAETSAIGRALANFGMAGTEYASADEVAQAISQRQAPVKRPAKPAGPVLATPPQKARIAVLLKERGVEPDEMKGVLIQEFGLSADNNSWTKEDAERVIEELS